MTQETHNQTSEPQGCEASELSGLVSVPVSLLLEAVYLLRIYGPKEPIAWADADRDEMAIRVHKCILELDSTH